MASTIDDLRERLEKIDAQRLNPFIRVRTDELREVLDELDRLEDEIDGYERKRLEQLKAAK